jgi:glycosyltransferase involved in cell wall biosynthesis
MYGTLSFGLGLVLYFAGVTMVVPRYLLGLNAALLPVTEWLVWYSGIPIVAGVALALVDIVFLLRTKRDRGEVRFDSVDQVPVTVALTAYNDELSIASSVQDFLSHPRVRRVIVVSNNSRDGTFAAAEKAGAVTFNEPIQGYGRCVYRCFTEALHCEDSELIVLCEGDMTFRAYDLDKLLAFAPHADVVNGTRTVERLRQYSTQLSAFMYYGNWVVGKLLEAKHLGRSTITDVGTTYKLCRRDALVNLMPCLNPSVNLEFNAHFLDQALANGLFVVECPITFHPRIGESKGGNTNDFRALSVGIRMIAGIVFGWKPLTR